VCVSYCNCRLIFGASLCMCAFNFFVFLTVVVCDFIVLSFVLPFWRNKIYITVSTLLYSIFMYRFAFDIHR